MRDFSITSQFSLCLTRSYSGGPHLSRVVVSQRREVGDFIGEHSDKAVARQVLRAPGPGLCVATGALCRGERADNRLSTPRVPRQRLCGNDEDIRRKCRAAYRAA